MILEFDGHVPQIAHDAFVAPNVTVIGRVDIGAESNIWYGSVVRGDVESITIGARTNIQDLSVIHVTTGTHPTRIGDDVTVGHRVILHGCTVQSNTLIGMGSVVMDGADIGEFSIIGAHALVTPGTQIPSGYLAVGSPARPVRPITDAERQFIKLSALHYVELASKHKALIKASQ